VIRNKQPQQQQQQMQSEVTAQPDEVEYSCLQHKKTNSDDLTNLLPSCSPQLYSILDSPHKPMIASYDSVESIGQQQHNSDRSLSASSGSDDVGSQHKPFQPISYLPPKSLSERRHRQTNNHRKRVRHHHSDSSIRKKKYSAPGKDDQLNKDEFLVRGTTLDGSVTLYAATPIGSPLPVDQAQPIFSMMSLQPAFTNDNSTTATPQPIGQHQLPQGSKVTQNISWQQMPSMVVHQQKPPISTALHSQSMPYASSNRVDPVTGSVLDQSVSGPGLDHSQNQSVNIPVTVNQHQPSRFQGVMSAELDNQGTRIADQHQGGLAHEHRTTDLGKHHQEVKTTDQHHQGAIISDQYNQGARITSQGSGTAGQGQHTTSLYQDVLDLMQKREAELKLELSNISSDKDKLQSENSRLLQENSILRNDTSSMLYMVFCWARCCCNRFFVF